MVLPLSIGCVHTNAFIDVIGTPFAQLSPFLIAMLATTYMHVVTEL